MGIETSEREFEIIQDVVRKTGISVTEIFSKQRHRPIVIARREVWYRLKEELGYSYKLIGRKFHRTHAAIIHSVKRYVKPALNTAISEQHKRSNEIHIYIHLGFDN